MFLYRMNKTMEMLGKQYPEGLIGEDAIAYNDFRNVIDAHEKKGNSTLFEIGMDAFMLGYIYGKRAERNKKRQSLNFGE